MSTDVCRTILHMCLLYRFLEFIASELFQCIVFECALYFLISIIYKGDAIDLLCNYL
jgi:hypothetical protein